VVLGPEVEDGEAPRPLDRLDVIGEERLARRVEPVQVLDQGHAGLTGALGVDQALHQAQQLALARLRVHARHGVLGVGDGEEVENQRQVTGEALIQQQQLAGDPLARRPVGVPLGDLEVGAHQLEHGQQRDGLGVRLAGDVIDGRALRPVTLHELVTEAALAHPGLAHDPDHLPLAGERLLQGALQHALLLVAPDEAREAAGALDVQAAARRAHAGQLMDAQRTARALDLELA
jgi:hypothetical protein